MIQLSVGGAASASVENAGATLMGAGCAAAWLAATVVVIWFGVA